MAEKGPITAEEVATYIRDFNQTLEDEELDFDFESDDVTPELVAEMNQDLGNRASGQSRAEVIWNVLEEADEVPDDLGDRFCRFVELLEVVDVE